MPASDRTSVRQRIIDMIVAGILAITAAGMTAVWLAHPETRHPTLHGLYGVWVILLLGSSIAAGVGAALRTTIPGRRLSVAFGLELWGWGACGFLVFWYAIFDYRAVGDWRLAGALLALTTLLVGEWLRLVSAMRQAGRADW